jgi:hypothetical protein
MADLRAWFWIYLLLKVEGKVAYLKLVGVSRQRSNRPTLDPTHQLLPANFRLGELHRNEGATGQPSSIGGTRPEKTHRSFRSRLAQQIARHVSYDTEHGFQLLRKEDPLTASPMIRTQGHSSMPRRMQPDHSHQLTLFVSTNQDVSFGVGAAWKERGVWKTRASSLGKHITTADAALFAIGMATKNLVSILSKADRSIAEIVTGSRTRLDAIGGRGQWTLPIVENIKRQAQHVEDAGGRVTLTWLSNDEDVEGYDIANTAAQRAAKQQPKEMRSATMSYVKQPVEARWKPRAKVNDNVANTKMSDAAHTFSSSLVMRSLEPTC